MGNNSSGIKFESGKLIELDQNNKILFNNILNNFNNLESKCIVLSMIGCARVGKSTFINGFLSYLFNENIDFVKTANGGDHCTLGIDYINFSYKSENSDTLAQIIILDCQGLLYEDSKNDDKLLSVIYSLSDIIVYHDTGIVNNQTLNALTPLCLVADQIKDTSDAKEIKPILFFRMRDYDLECNPQEIIQKTFKKQNDQYDKVRGAINKLFPIISAITTDPLGKNEKAELKDRNYMSILHDNEYGFNGAYNQILQCISNINIKTVGSLCKHANKVITQINNNEKISFNDYDYYTLLIEKRFSGYWDKINHDIYTTIISSSKDVIYESCINRLGELDVEIEKFKESFSEVEQTMLDEEINKFKAKIEPHILQTMKQCDEMAQCEIDDQMKELLDKYFLPTLQNISIFGNIFTLLNMYNHIPGSLDLQEEINKNIDKLCKHLVDHDKLCKITVNKTKAFLTEQMINIYDNIVLKTSTENSLFKSINKKCIEVLEHVTNINYLENKIKEIKIFTINRDYHFSILQKFIKNEITKELRAKFFKYEIDEIVYSNCTMAIKWSTGGDLSDEALYYMLFKNLGCLVDQCVDNDIFTTKRDHLTKIYIQHAKSQLSQAGNICFDIMKEQSLISFTILYFLIDDEKMKIIQQVLNNTTKCQIEFLCDNKYGCYQLKEEVENILKVLCDYVDFENDYVIDKLLVNNKILNHPSNIRTYTIDFNKLFGKVFITRIINKYVDQMYLKN